MSYKVVLRDKLKSQFGYDDYKNYLQKKATEAVYIGKKDICICMPSGFGKSLCFQLPVTIKKNSFAIVISPTIACAKNQVDYLRNKNILAYNWNAYTPQHIKISIKKNMRSSNPKMKLLYITPDQYISSHFQLRLTCIKPNVLSYLVIDEAHCLSPWSHDFRPFYRKLFEWPQKHPGVSIIAVTATAIKEVREDIFKILQMKNPLIFSMPVFRSNLFYDIWFIDILPDPFGHLKQFIEESLGFSKVSIPKDKRNCGIIFCQNRDTIVSLANILNSMGIPTLFYDTRSNIRTRFKIQHLWNSGEVNVIITTNSFGIGIDKQTVRFTVHWYNFLSIGNYYQESGRAGHDGKTSYCRIYCYLNKMNNFNKFFEKQKLFLPEYENQLIHLQTKIILFLEMIKGVFSMECRHAVISKYFGDPVPNCVSHCDVCRDKDATKERISQLKYFCQFNSTSNESFENFNLDKYEYLIEYFKNDFKKLLSHEKPLNTYVNNENEIEILLKNLQKLEASIYDINEDSSVIPMLEQKLDELNCIRQIHQNKSSEYMRRNLSSPMYNPSTVEFQLETINKILYIRQTEKTSNSIKLVDNIFDSNLSNICETVIVENSKIRNDVKNLKTVENINEINIEHSAENEILFTRQLGLHSCNLINAELQLAEINRILY